MAQFYICLVYLQSDRKLIIRKRSIATKIIAVPLIHAAKMFTTLGGHYSCFLYSSPGPLNMALMVPDVKACSLFTINSWPSEEINFTYMASGPSQPP